MRGTTLNDVNDDMTCLCRSLNIETELENPAQ